ncbi:MAG: hypothetical protein IJJ28_00205, partial [Lentisphaeria bacterium]|nr:hypothetical protein [Lentisphaeria bacterium]
METALLIVTGFAVSIFGAWKTFNSGSGSPRRLQHFVFAGVCLSPALYLAGLLCVNLLIPGCLAGTLHYYEYADGLIFESVNRHDRIARLTVTEAFFNAPGAALVVAAAGGMVKLPDAAPETLVKCG